MLVNEEATIRMKDRSETWFYVYVERIEISCWVSSGTNGTVDIFGDNYPHTNTGNADLYTNHSTRCGKGCCLERCE